MKLDEITDDFRNQVMEDLCRQMEGPMYDPCGDPDDFQQCSVKFALGVLGFDDLVEYRAALQMQFEAGAQYCPLSQWERYKKNHENEIAEIDQELQVLATAKEKNNV